MEKRKNTRYQTLARVKIGKTDSFKGAGEGETLLRDISITGCCVQCTVALDIKEGETYTVEVIPETTAKIGHFVLSVQVRWIKQSNYACDIGFEVLESPKGKEFQRYVDYLDWRANTGVESHTL